VINPRQIERLALLGRARVVRLDGAQVMLRLDPPLDANPAWPANVYALRAMPYMTARSLRGLTNR